MNTKNLAALLYVAVISIIGYFSWILNDSLLSTLICFVLGILIVNLILDDIISYFKDKDKPGD